MGTRALTIVPKQPSELNLSELADAFGDASEKLDQISVPYDKAAKIEAALKKELQARFAGAAAAGDHEAEGLRWLIQVSKRRKEKTLKDAWATYKLLKLNVRAFVALIMAYIPQTFLVEKLGKPAAAAQFDEADTGYRTLTPVRKAEPNQIA